MIRSNILAIILASSSIFAEEVKLKNTEEKVSYLLGRNIGDGLRQDEVKVNIESLLLGLQESYANTKSKISDEDAQKLLTEFYTDLQNKQKAEADDFSQKRLEEGRAFLEKNGKREGVITTDSGLQYEIISTGKGAKPKEKDYVKVHYHGTLMNGVIFKSTVDEGIPGDFRVDKVIPGLQEALQLMTTGSKWKLYLPTELGLGDHRSGKIIGPNDVLIYELELLSIRE